VFALGTFSHNGGAPYPGLVVDDQVGDLRTEFGDHATTMDLFESWDGTLERLRALAAAELTDPRPLQDLRPLPPIQPLGQVMCAGANYRSHTIEQLFVVARKALGETRSDNELWAEAEATVSQRAAEGTPFMFVAQASAISGAQDDVVLWGPGVEHDWEVELAVVIGRPARNVSPEHALTHVAGYTISNDISTRDVMFRPTFRLSDFMRSKLRPGFFPTGPYVVPREFVSDYRRLRITLKLNGQVMQDESVDDMTYGVEQLISYASTLTDLHPGDLLLTGSPAGNAAIHGDRWLRPGDVMESAITGLGAQRNLCVADPHPTA
jgi:2-keto-4-pentenoate hydratase/2-oxohepta-3-ene-1,7-dioic acid hydratase in catechol pathway